MAKVIAELSMSLDGYVAGPEQTLEAPLGTGGMDLHEWAFRLEAWRKAHGIEGGETGDDSPMVEEGLAAQGAVVMGRKMFSGGSGPWESDHNRNGWWGENPPFHVPVFVVTHHEREPLPMEGGTTFTFVTGGVEPAIAAAREAAGERDVHVSGGAAVVQQCLAAELVDELLLHHVPLLLGDGGVRLFDGAAPGKFEIAEVIDAPLATHVRYRVAG